MTKHEYVTLAHGNGGCLMRELIEQVISKPLANSQLNINNDSAILSGLNITGDRELVMSSDSFTVQPWKFPGGDIGSLAAHGVINDLAVAAAEPSHFSLNIIIEEGLKISTLEQAIESLARTCKEHDIAVVCGDTKVVPRGEGSGLYLAVTGIGTKPASIRLGMEQIKPGDKIIVSGSVGDHGAAIMLARESFGLQSSLKSDAASILPISRALLSFSGLRFMRDPTRGGLATVAHEIKHATQLGAILKEEAIPISEAVRSMCEMLGYDPLYLACEGRLVAVVAADQADMALEAIRQSGDYTDAAIIGEIRNQDDDVCIETEIGGLRILPELENDPLPRIC